MLEIELIQKQLEIAKQKGLILRYETMSDLSNETLMSINVFFTKKTRYKTKEQFRDFLMRNYSTLGVVISKDESYITITRIIQPML